MVVCDNVRYESTICKIYEHIERMNRLRSPKWQFPIREQISWSSCRNVMYGWLGANRNNNCTKCDSSRINTSGSGLVHDANGDFIGGFLCQ